MSTDLLEAIEQHDSARVNWLLANGSDPNGVSLAPPYWRPLHVAIEQLEEGGNVDVILALLHHGADVNGWDSNHDVTPLLLAIFNGQLQVIETLLNGGADPNVVNGEGDSPLRAIVRNRDSTTASLLIRAGAARTIDEYGGLDGLTALGMAARNLDIPTIKLLLDAGANPESRDEDNKTARLRLPPMNEANEEARRTAEALLDPGPKDSQI